MLIEENNDIWEMIFGIFGGYGATILTSIIYVLIVFILGRYLIKFLLNLFEGSRLYKNLDATVASFLKTALKFGLNCLLLVVIIAMLGIPTSSIVAIIASCGLAIGMALQGSLANLAGGIMLLINRPFSLGDYIKSTTNEGYVQNISLFYTSLLNKNRELVLIPNGCLMNASVINCSYGKNRCLQFEFTFKEDNYLDKVNDIEKALKEIGLENIETLYTAIDNEGIKVKFRSFCAEVDYEGLRSEAVQKLREFIS